jgi:hypothetical protein
MMAQMDNLHLIATADADAINTRGESVEFRL